MLQFQHAIGGVAGSAQAAGNKIDAIFGAVLKFGASHANISANAHHINAPLFKTGKGFGGNLMKIIWVGIPYIRAKIGIGLLLKHLHFRVIVEPAQLVL